jgi:AcrR family transcriptional regulator
MSRSSVVTPPGANRFERRRERTRGELLAAATRVLARHGFAGTKIADIAREADVGVGTFYLHFATKDALLDALVEDTVTRLKRVLDAAREREDDPVARVRAGNAALCRFASDNRDVLRIVFGPGAALHESVRRALALFAADVEDTIRHGVARAAFADVPPAVTAQAVIGTTAHLLAWWTEHEEVGLDVLEATMNRMTLDGLRAVPIPPKGA